MVGRIAAVHTTTKKDGGKKLTAVGSQRYTPLYSKHVTSTENRSVVHTDTLMFHKQSISNVSINLCYLDARLHVDRDMGRKHHVRRC